MSLLSVTQSFKAHLAVVVEVPLQLPSDPFKPAHVVVVPSYELQAPNESTHYFPFDLHPVFQVPHSASVVAVFSLHNLALHLVPVASPAHSPSVPIYPIQVEAFPS